MQLQGQEVYFLNLVDAINQINRELAVNAGKAVNISLTLRNWFIGCYISEYQLCGADRAKYGEKLLHDLAKELHNISNCNRRQLYRYLRLYRFYPQIVGTLSPQFRKNLPKNIEAIKVGTLYPQLHPTGEALLQNLSYSHFGQLVDIDQETKRAFYEIECIRGNWSVRELRRQINSLYYERSSLSFNKEKLARLANSCAEQENHQLNIRDPYVFEFLGLHNRGNE